MIRMISSASLRNSDSKAIHHNEAEEPEKDDFAALLQGLSAFVPPVVPPPVNLKANAAPEKSGENSVDSPKIEASGDAALKPSKQLEETIALPDSFSQITPKEIASITPEKLFAQKAEINADFESEKNSFREIEDFRDAEVAPENENLLNQIEEITAEFAPETDGKSNFKETENQFRPEISGSEAGKNETPNKLPKLFREVSSFFEVSGSAAKNQPLAAETAAPAPTGGANAAAQIEPQIAQMIAMAIKTEKPQILKMRLNPAELGGLEIKIEKDAAGRINAHFSTEKEETRKILTENIAQLRDSLQDSGWQIDRVEVSCDADSFAGNEARENSSQAEENAARNSFADTNDSGGQTNTKEDLNSEKSNRLLSVRA